MQLGGWAVGGEGVCVWGGVCWGVGWLQCAQQGVDYPSMALVLNTAFANHQINRTASMRVRIGQSLPRSTYRILDQ